MVTASALTDGMVIRVEGQVYSVLRVESKAAAAKMGGVVKAELSNVVSGRVWEARFRPQEHVEELQVERRNMEFLCKRLTNTPVRQAGPVLKCPDDCKNRVVNTQATFTSGSSAVGGRVCEQRYAAERVLPESGFELRHAGSPSKETALEEKA